MLRPDSFDAELLAPFINFLSVPDGFNPNVLLLIDEIDDPVGTDSKREFAFKIAEKLFSGKGI
jgi:hypothetical protein